MQMYRPCVEENNFLVQNVMLLLLSDLEAFVCVCSCTRLNADKWVPV